MVMCAAAHRATSTMSLSSRCVQFATVVLTLVPILATVRSVAQTSSDAAQLHESFSHPPDDCRIMMRWWWFGPSVTKPELRRELEQMKAAGIGGVEIANLYPLALDDPASGFRNLPFLSDEHIEALRYAAAEARKLGLRVDITLGSGWPFGGPHIPVTQSAGLMRVETVAIPRGASSIAVPALSVGEEIQAALFVPGTGAQLDFKSAKAAGETKEGRLQLPADVAPSGSAVFFISSRTGMMVKRPSVGAEGFVLDHYDRKAIETHLHSVGDRLMQAFGDQPPYAIFSDSLEDYGSNWTPDLLQQFRRRRGYDLAPHLSALIADVGPETAAVRHDWGKTLTELTNENFLAPLHAWAQQHHTLLRSQTYGFPPATLSSNRDEDLPEGEGKASILMWRQFSETRWAASAGHLFFANPVISSETWTWLHSPAFRATPLDMKAEADLHFLQGINQLVGHGWPYSPEAAGDPGWRMYAAGAFDAHNPWYFAMPDLTSYLQRVSFALRQGKPAYDVALLLPNDDVWASFTVGASTSGAVTSSGGFNTRGSDLSMDESMPAFLGKAVIPQILDAGFNFDFIDADAIDSLGVRYPVLVLPGIERLPLETYRKIEQYAQHGGIVIATRRLPSIAPGLLDADNESQEVQQISQRLFEGSGAPGRFIADESGLSAALGSRLKPDVVLSPKTPEIGFIQRRLDAGDLYFIANTDNQPHRAQVSFRTSAKNSEWWDAFTGEVSAAGDPLHLDLELEPYESRLLFVSDAAAIPAHKKVWKKTHAVNIDLGSDWELTFGDEPKATHVDRLRSWSEDESHRYYAGKVAYDKTVELAAHDLGKGARLLLDFGPCTPVPEPDPLPEFNMRAYLESPVREAAEIYVNGERAGVVWHPPYTIDVTRFLKPGANALRIIVGNTAINSLAGRALPDYRLLNARYGERFVPQGMENLQPLPSGILGPLRLISTP